MNVALLILLIMLFVVGAYCGLVILHENAKETAQQENFVRGSFSVGIIVPSTLVGLGSLRQKTHFLPSFTVSDADGASSVSEPDTRDRMIINLCIKGWQNAA